MSSTAKDDVVVHKTYCSDLDLYRLYVFGGREHLFAFFFLAYIDLRGQLERDPESDRLGHPPPPTHHDLMKIY